MEKKIEGWDAIAALIDADKTDALEWFHRGGFVSAALGADARGTQRLRRGVRFLPLLAAAACLVLTVGLGLFFWRQGSWPTAPAAAGMDGLLADSFLYNAGREPEAAAPAANASSSFFPFFAAWGKAAGLNHVTAPTVKAGDPSLLVDHGDPAAVQRKMKKVIQENSIERMLTQFCQVCKEV